MAFVILKELYLAYGDRTLLDHVSLTLDSHSKIALAGANGCGKSTLMKILGGNLSPDDGEVSFSKGAKVGFMAQSNAINLDKNLYAIADEAFNFSYAIDKKIEQLDHLATEASLLERTELYDQLLLSGFYEREGLIDATLIGLGFKRTDFTKKMATFSSGWCIRAALARVLLENADILLLDEPSNYLDMEATHFLIDWLKRFNGSILLVSHDRYFLDETTNETIELFNGKLKRYPCNYSNYEKRRQLEIEELIRQRIAQEERIKQIEDYVRRFGAKATKAAQAQSRLKELRKIDLVDLPENLKSLHISFPSPPPSGERVLYLENVGKSYTEGLPIFNHLTMLIVKGEKIAVVGGNGAGKSSLLGIIAGLDNNFTGYMKRGSGVEIGYFSEERHEEFSQKTVIEEVELTASASIQPEIRNLLAAFLYRGDDIYKPVSGLSGGEKARLLLLKLFLKPFNLLILDEPTNHLDLQAKDALLLALKNYPGSLLFVSHDRYFVESLAQYVLHVGPEAKYYNGDYNYYLEQRSKNEEKIETVSKKSSQSIILTDAQRSREGSKKEASENRKKERKIEELMRVIEEKEKEKKLRENQLALPEIYSNGQKVKEIGEQLKEIGNHLRVLYEEWDLLIL